MPIYDFQCDKGHVTERYAGITDISLPCEKCGGEARRIISVGGSVHLANQDAPWLKSVLEVVDKDPTKPHCQRFLKEQTRDAYHAWMKGEGIKPMGDTHHGGPPVAGKPKEPDMSRVEERLLQRHRERMRIEI